MLSQLTGQAVVATAVPEVLVLITHALRRDVQRMTRGMPLTLEFVGTPELAMARIESACPEIVVIDDDMMACSDEVCRFARSLRPDVRLVAVTCRWSEREAGLRGCADAIIHKPLREAEWKHALTPLA